MLGSKVYLLICRKWSKCLKIKVSGRMLACHTALEFDLQHLLKKRIMPAHTVTVNDNYSFCL